MARYLFLYWLALVGIPLLLFVLVMQLNLAALPEPQGTIGKAFMAGVGLYFLPFGYLFGAMAYNSTAGIVLVLTGYSIAAVGLAAITTWMRNKSRPPLQ